MQIFQILMGGMNFRERSQEKNSSAVKTDKALELDNKITFFIFQTHFDNLDNFSTNFIFRQQKIHCILVVP